MSRRKVVSQYSSRPCPFCGSNNTYARLKTYSFVCRKCGSEFKYNRKKGYCNLADEKLLIANGRVVE